MTDVIINAMAPVANWEINFLVDHGPLKFLAVHAFGLLALWCGGGLAIHLYERRQARRGGGS